MKRCYLAFSHQVQFMFFKRLLTIYPLVKD
jgi:hypothetical protein